MRLLLTGAGQELALRGRHRRGYSSRYEKQALPARADRSPGRDPGNNAGGSPSLPGDSAQAELSQNPDPAGSQQSSQAAPAQLSK